MLTRAFSTTFHSNSYNFNGKIYFFANFEKNSTYLERTTFFCSHQKIKITPRNNIPPVHGGYILPPVINSRGVPRGVTPRTPRLYITMSNDIKTVPKCFATLKATLKASEHILGSFEKKIFSSTFRASEVIFSYGANQPFALSEFQTPNPAQPKYVKNCQTPKPNSTT